MRNLEKIVMYQAGQKEAWQPIKSIPSTPFSGKTLPFPLSFQLQVEIPKPFTQKKQPECIYLFIDPPFFKDPDEFWEELRSLGWAQIS